MSNCKLCFPLKIGPPAIVILWANVESRYGKPTIVTFPNEKANRNGELPVQLLEECEYEFEVNAPGIRLSSTGRLSGVVFPSRIKSGKFQRGRISTGRHVGVVKFVLEDDSGPISSMLVKVRPAKLEGDEDFKVMLSFIAEKCTDLTSQIRSVGNGCFAPDPGKNVETIAQRFAFLSSVLQSNDFQVALDRILSQPYQKLARVNKTISISKGGRVTRSMQRQLSQGGRRIKIPKEHPLAFLLETVPEHLRSVVSEVTIDTQENRFVKFVLGDFLAFLSKMIERLKSVNSEKDVLTLEVGGLKRELEAVLARPFFRSISDMRYLHLSSPVLQKREGYRKVLRSWYTFYMGAQIAWKGGADVYFAGQRDSSSLYEYWLFFKVSDVVSEVFELKMGSANNFIEETVDGLGLKLKAGKHLRLEGIYTRYERSLQVCFSFNRSFSSVDSLSRGSWTLAMRPDFTLSFWPAICTESEAELNGVVTHIHFDAKYRMTPLPSSSSRNELGESSCYSKNDENCIEDPLLKGMCKSSDILKMHAYKDAIRGTLGAYIIYPGTFRRIWSQGPDVLPGVGAFPLRPGTDEEKGVGNLKSFIQKIANDISNRSNLREREIYLR